MGKLNYYDIFRFAEELMKTVQEVQIMEWQHLIYDWWKRKGGIVGDYQDLSKLWNNNLNFKVDYRSLYEFILRNHFNFQKNPFSKYKDNLFI